MTYLLDTNACIGYINGTSEGIRRHLESLTPEDIVVCSIVRAELHYGAWKSSRPTENLRNVERFLSRFRSLPFDDPAAETYGLIRAQLERQGTPIGPNDLLIAAIARRHEVVLVTHNTREFERIEELALNDWE